MKWCFRGLVRVEKKPLQNQFWKFCACFYAFDIFFGTKWSICFQNLRAFEPEPPTRLNWNFNIALKDKKLWFLHNFSKHSVFSQKCIVNTLLLIRYQNTLNMTSCHNILCPGCSKTKIRGPNNFLIFPRDMNHILFSNYLPKITFSTFQHIWIMIE